MEEDYSKPVGGLSTTAVKEQTPLKRQLTEQEKLIMSLQMAVDKLENIISPVLRPLEPSQEIPSEAPDVPLRSEVVAVVGDNNSRLHGLGKRLADITDRVEV